MRQSFKFETVLWLLHLVIIFIETILLIVTNMSEQRKAVIKNADMAEDMQQDAVDCASQALSKFNVEKVRRETSGA